MVHVPNEKLNSVKTLNEYGGPFRIQSSGNTMSTESVTYGTFEYGKTWIPECQVFNVGGFLPFSKESEVHQGLTQNENHSLEKLVKKHHKALEILGKH